MPHANIWIRKEDQELWDKVENKSEFISLALRKQTPKIEPRVTVETKFCKHGSPIGLCKFGCKK